MALTTNTQSNAESIVNVAVGRIVTDSATAAAITLTIGFVPRMFRWLNITSTAAMQKDEFYEGMASGSSLRTLAAATTPASSQMTLVSSGAMVINTDGTVTIPSGMIPASSTFAWEAIG